MLRGWQRLVCYNILRAPIRLRANRGLYNNFCVNVHLVAQVQYIEGFM